PVRLRLPLEALLRPEPQGGKEKGLTRGSPDCGERWRPPPETPVRALSWRVGQCGERRCCHGSIAPELRGAITHSCCALPRARRSGRRRKSAPARPARRSLC